MSQAPIFQSIFGVPWASLPPVMQKHYAVRPNSRDRVVVRGTMNVKRSLWMQLLSPFLRIFGALIPCDGNNISATVTFTSGPGSADFHFDRILQLPNGSNIRFHSRLVQIAGNDVIELMRFGLGWRSRYRIEGGHIALHQIGYFWRIGKRFVPLPVAWLMGKVSASEDALTDNSFKMAMTIIHPLFGQIYSYSGTFEIAEVFAAD